ncbi:MAG: TIGR04283 family arsenosugar biosynthesis glycosyltransferase [Candidatus Velthaea sp.]
MIMPVLNEASNLAERAAELARQSGPLEWIVADGGSSDDSVALARSLGAQVVVSPRGRGRQMDAGAAAAVGDVFLFLHADTALDDGALSAIRLALADERVAGGNFTLRFDDDGAAGRLFVLIYALQQRLMRVYFGDSAIFVRRATFALLAGFGTEPLMEDYAFVRRLEAHGRTRKLRSIVRTSARRYRGRPVRTLLRWMVLMLLYRLGVSPARLQRFYREHGASN